MNKEELKFFIAGVVALAIVLIVLISCVTYYNIAQLKTISDGQPTTTILYIHKLDDEQFAQLIDSLKVDKEKSDGTKQ